MTSDVNHILNPCGLCPGRGGAGGGGGHLDGAALAGRDFDAELEQRARKHEREFFLDVQAALEGGKEVRHDIYGLRVNGVMMRGAVVVSCQMGWIAHGRFSRPRK